MQDVRRLTTMLARGQEHNRVHRNSATGCLILSDQRCPAITPESIREALRRKLVEWEREPQYQHIERLELTALGKIAVAKTGSGFLRSRTQGPNSQNRHARQF